MFRVMNKGTRSFIVKKESVIKGGEVGPDKECIYINPGQTVEVTTQCGKFLASYSDITVLEKTKDK